MTSRQCVSNCIRCHAFLISVTCCVFLKPVGTKLHLNPNRPASVTHIHCLSLNKNTLFFVLSLCVIHSRPFLDPFIHLNQTTFFFFSPPTPRVIFQNHQHKRFPVTRPSLPVFLTHWVSTATEFKFKLPPQGSIAMVT